MTPEQEKAVRERFAAERGFVQPHEPTAMKSHDELCAHIDHAAVTRGQGAADARQIADDHGEVRTRYLQHLAGNGDVGVWNTESHKAAVRYAIASGLVTEGEIAGVLEKHGLTGAVTL